jgi:rhomboid protease GluP
MDPSNPSTYPCIHECRYYYFVAIYLLSGAAGNVVSFMFNDLITVGASGAIFGLLGALTAYFARNPNLERSAIQIAFLLGLVTLNIALGTMEDTMVDNAGHIAGFVSGLWLGWSACPVWKVSRNFLDSLACCV